MAHRCGEGCEIVALLTRENLRGRAGRRTLGGKEITFHDGVVATVSGNDRRELAHDTFHTEKGLRRTAELAQVEKLIGAARYVKDGEVEEHNRDRFSKFRYYGVTTRYKGEEESLLLNIGKNKFTGKYNFYTITVDDGE